jgi:hypothetical protein
MVKYKSKKTTRSFFLSFLLMSLTFVTNAQGWSFQFNLAYAGNCGTTPNIVLPTMPNNLFQTQAQCEAIRQQFLAIKESGGGCTVYYACTPCTGSDIIIPGQTNPGEISSSGQFEGKPLFTPHQSKAFEDWAKDYKQQLESYGIKSILGMSITPNNSIPSSGNAKVDKIYKDDVDNFNPKSQPINDPNVVDLSKSSGVVSLLSTSEDQVRRDRWCKENGLAITSEIPKEGIPELDPIGKMEEEPFWTSKGVLGVGALAVTSIIAPVVIETYVVGSTASFLIGTAVDVGVGAAKDYLGGESGQKIVTESAKTIKKDSYEEIGKNTVKAIFKTKGEVITKIYDVAKNAPDLWKLATKNGEDE